MSSLTVKKKGNVVHRTTSETLRLGDYISQVRATIQSTTRKKSQATSPSCSFQITGVSLTRYDIGDDSADDLDESHTDDISRVTDNETPSFSEDSRDTDEPPVTAPDTTTETETDTTTTVEETEEPQSEAKEELKDLSIGRFKVVKIESIVPFSRGRWTCFDYLDQSDSSKSCCKHFKTEQNETLKASIAIDQNRVPNTAKECETNCQEPLFPGSIKMSQTAPIFAAPPSRPPRVKIRTSCVSTPSIIPIIRPIRSVRPFFTSSSSFDSVITLHDQGTLRKECDVANSNANILLVQEDSNRNTGASVSCTATIDTKIEHALQDVVKNHLTHAVRLEVEDLKVKINELVDRITYLEYENDLLRANVDPDVLANLENNVTK
ncbi:unnamed protein product [Acanthoscelides obtectus]|uniref:Uncharacterized protein n=1 Tax=Acanthoscelides obtectus TaxID=200917 RepID=A0A9P0K0Y5_ACAOB|nr:unnamed protein product [Acanthoscelides obtectus]CAK1628778.1 TSC22 domain family protein 4 [Acanthoscelides obtectus]